MRTTAIVAGILVLLTVGALMALRYFGPWPPALTGSPGPSGAAPAATYVGAQACAGCHAKEHAAWAESDHARAMQHANETTVLGDFADRRFAYGATTSTFFRREGRYMVRTDGPDGKLADFEIKYTFGVRPLQQYLIELPGGRLQALSIAWDARSREAGGRRWFHLYPNENIDFRDELHWTRRQQNWNYMCADCHSTNVRKNYDSAANRYATTWSEINVACEACHGPGSGHVRGQRPQRADGGLARTARCAMDHRPGLGQRQAECGARHRPRAGGLRPVSFAAEPDLVRLRRRSTVPRLLPSGPARVPALLARRTAARRGVYLGLVPREPDARRRCDV
jgi:hypothetical protein